MPSKSSRRRRRSYLSMSSIVLPTYREVNCLQVLTRSLPVGNMSCMDKLLAYINKSSLDERARFCSEVGTTEGYLRKACSTGQKLGPALCVSIERATNGAVTRRDLRPHDWYSIWPELADDAGAIHVEEAA